MRRLELEIPGLPKMANGGHYHWRTRYKDNEEWKQRVCGLVRAAGWKGSPLNKASVALTRCSSVRPDYDGLVAGMKRIIDGLVEAGVLIDDNWDVIAMPIFRWEHAAQRSGKIRVVVEEIKGESDASFS